VIATYKVRATLNSDRSQMPTLVSGSAVLLNYNKYNTNNTVQSTTDATTGLTTSYTYTADGQVQDITRSWTDSGSSHSVTDSHTTYDSSGRVSTTTDANGKTTTTTYNSIGKVATTTDQYGGETSYTYDVMGNLIRTQYPDGTETRTVYDAMGRAIWTSDRNTTEVLNSGALATHTIYDSIGRVTGTERYKNVVLTLTSDSTASGLFKSVEPVASSLTGKKLSSTTTSYNANGQVAETDSSTGLKTGTIYYPNGQVKYSGILSAAAIALGSGWENVGDASLIFDSYTFYQYDLIDNLPTGAISYDAVTDANGHTTKTYKDVLGREMKTIYDDGSFTQTLYSVGDQAISGFDLTPTIPAGGSETIKIAQHKSSDPIVATICVYDAAGRLTDEYLPAVADALNSGAMTRPHWHYTYDANGNELSQTDPKGHTTSFTYDALGNQLTRTLPGNEQETNTYDGFGRLSTHVDFDGNTAIYIYYPAGDVHAGMLKEVDYYAPGKTPGTDSPDQTVAYTYDSLGRKATVNDSANGLTTYTYDPITGNVSQVVSPEGTINYEYDPATGQHTRTYTTSNDTHYDYDLQGRISHVTVVKLNGVTLSTPQVTTYTYDLVGDLQSVTDPNSVKTTYGYDDLNRLTDETVADGSRNIFTQHFDLASNGDREDVIEKRYDNSGNLFSTTKVAWTYDADDRLLTETRDEGNDGVQNGGDYTDSYTFDLAGNRITKVHDGVGTSSDETITSSYNNDNQLTAVDSTINANDATYAYDADGNMTSVTTNGATKRYVWDLRNRLVGFDANGDGDLNDTGDATYTYDNDGNRVSKTVIGQGTTYYVVDTNNPTGYAKAIEEKSSPSSAPIRSYILGHDVIGQSNGTVIYLVKEGHGTTRTVTDSSGLVISNTTYDDDAFGNAIDFNPATALTVWLNPDGTFDAESGLTNQNARETDRSIGRFISGDDITLSAGDWQNANMYLYVGGNPISGIDPSGHLGLVDTLVVAGIGAFIGGLSTYAVNYATGQHHNIVTGALFGAVALPLAIALPVFGLGLAGYGAYQSWNMTWDVWTNPRSTNGQLAASLVLFGASLFGVYAAGTNVAANGWYNPRFVSPTVTNVQPLTANTPLSQLFEGVPDNAMVHGSNAPLGDLYKGVEPSAYTGKSYWFRWGDVKHLTVQQYQNIAGQLAPGGLPDANTFVFKLLDNQNMFQPGAKALNYYQEYNAAQTVVPDAGGAVGPKG
jgi:RHS repeat-associated protein